ncbi:uncharacterized protein MAL13P1.304-like isoform X2 [Vanessa cardui]|uniref:uncharacterized protein MAL13P1.304-like isoform X2 n=1 Tax=Vanessa cardui TaxID=171605 RepID=UPI001F141ADB|nr:uncharacterized protein MAL13P1.304-like isoform X2 [Vanessa cardui]
MDDLYDNLENYNDVNIVDELKCENRELKLKLEEISKAMGILQKDFDKVSSEYKQLEINYSSLLKTARAEIERKTEMIKDLNFQKDMIVINAMKETGKNILNVKKGNFNSKEKGKKNNKTVDTVFNKQQPNMRAAPPSNHHKDNGVDACNTPSIDTISITSTGNKSTSSEEKATKPVDSMSCEINKKKDFFSKDSHKDETLQCRNKVIMNRRKSMLGMSQHEAKFSSDDDNEPKYSATRKSPPRSDLKHNEWHDTRDYRIEPHEYYEPSKENSRFRSSRYSNYEKFRNVDRHDTFQKNRRQYSPERDQQRYINEYNEDYHGRGDYGKQRNNSPSNDKYNRSKSRDRRFNYERDNYRENDKYSNRYYEHSGVKHRTRNDFDEPCSKRQKMDVHGKSATEANTYVNNKEREYMERNHVSKSQYKLNTSCQSPDHVNVESSGSQHFVKEIMNTAETKLEDPRLSSKKYILKTSNDSTILSTVVGRDVDMQCVDKTLWGIEKNDVPAELSKPVSDQGNDGLLKEIHMEIDNPELHNTLESGEIEDSNDDLATIYSKEIDKKHDNENDGSKAKTDSETRNLNVFKEKDTQTLEKSLKTKFKIPKIKKPDKMDKEKNFSHQEHCDITTKKNLELDDNVNNHQNILQNIEHVPSKQHNQTNKSKKDIKDNSESERAIIDKRTQDIMRTIEGDLELSDEASDIVEFHNDTNNKSNENSRESKIILSKNKDGNSSNRNENKSDVTSLKPEPINSKKADKTLAKDYSKESSKKRKSKRKSMEQKETHSITSEQQNEKCHTTKKSKEKESKKTVSKQTISKFSDLFGDSSSLITPDDLGLNNMQVQSVEKYTSIFENTQDAVDLSVEDMAKTLTSANKVNAFDSVGDKLHDKKVSDDITNNFSVNVTVVNENVENMAEDVQSPINVYENTKSETLTDGSNIVKTVIISSGIQPECSTESTTVAAPQIHAPSLAPITNDVGLKKCPLNSIKALATSTPQKLIEHIDVSERDSLCSAPSEDVSASVNMTNSSSLNNTDALPTEQDVPDVRIFVRRRRKPVRKAT